MSARFNVILGPLAALVLLLHAGHYRHEWTDDAFITFRYARNFAAGDGMVFNPGERIEGITNLGWALLLAPFADGDLLLVAQIAGVAAGLVTALVLAAWARRSGLGPLATGVTLAGMVLAPWPAYWMLQGLETPIVMLTCTLGWARYRADAAGETRAPASGLALAAGPWLRPDQALLAALIGAWHLWTRGLARSRPAAVAAAVVAASAVALVALKLAWYGEILPNTFHVKVDNFPPDRGLGYLVAFLTTPGPLLPGLVLGCAALGVWWAARRDDRGLPGLVFLAFLGAAVLQNGDIFANFRLLVPAWPAACAAMGLAVQAAVDAAGARFGEVASERAALLGKLGVAALFGAPLAQAAALQHVDALNNGPHRIPVQKPAPLVAPWRAATWDDGPRDQWPFPAAWAVVNAGPTSTVAYTELGLIGFVQEGPILDLLGLTDSVMAGRNGEDWNAQHAYVNGRASAFAINTLSPAWSRWRPILGGQGWEPAAGCGSTWIFRSTTVPPAPPDAAELDRRLALVLDRAPRMQTLLVGIAQELVAADAPAARVGAWLDAVEARGTVSADLLAAARCQAGLTAGCARSATRCEGKNNRLAGDALRDALPEAVADVLPGLSGTVLAHAGAGAGPAVGPDGQALAGAPLPDAQASTSRKDPAACGQARDAAARKWARVLERMPDDPAFTELRGLAEQIVAAAGAGEGDLAGPAERAAALAEPLYARWPELRRALQEAVRLSHGAAERCG